MFHHFGPRATAQVPQGSLCCNLRPIVSFGSFLSFDTFELCCEITCVLVEMKSGRFIWPISPSPK